MFKTIEAKSGRIWRWIFLRKITAKFCGLKAAKKCNLKLFLYITLQKTSPVATFFLEKINVINGCESF